MLITNICAKHCSSLVICLLCLICTLSLSGAAQQFCSANSAIDGIPFFVGQNYQDILKRAPESTGQIMYIDALEGLNTSSCNSADPTLAAGSCEWANNPIATLSILDSTESIAKNGSLSDNLAFVTVLYKLLLHRDPDTPGLSYFVSQLNSGVTRLSVVAMFLNGNEYRHRFACAYNGTSPASCYGATSVDPVPSFVIQTYEDILDRPADASGQSFWTNTLTANQTAMCRNSSSSTFSLCDRMMNAEMTLQFLESSEYLSANPPISQNSDFVTALYEHLLQRPPDSTGLNFYTNYLNQTNDRVGTIYAFLSGEEYRQRFTCYAGQANQLNVGINGHPFTGLAYSDSMGVDFSTQLSLLQGAGLKWYRVDVSAPSSGGDYSAMDNLLSISQAAGVQLLPDLFPTVNRGSDSLNQMYSESYSGAYNIVSHYRNSIHVWELSNEEDIYSLYAPGDPYQGGTWPWGPPPGDSISDLYPPRLAISEAILRGLADGVRAADPGALRVINMAWVHTGFIQAIENDAVPYEILGIHWYSNADVTDDTGMGDITCPGQALPCQLPLKFFNEVDQFHTLTNGKPLWITETNYVPVATNSVNTNIMWEENYIAPILQMYIEYPVTYPFQVAMIYELLDQPDLSGGPQVSQMGLYQDILSSNGNTITLGSPKPAYLSIQQLLLP